MQEIIQYAKIDSNIKTGEGGRTQIEKIDHKLKILKEEKSIWRVLYFSVDV